MSLVGGLGGVGVGLGGGGVHPFSAIHFWWSLCTLNLVACQMRVTICDPGRCCVVSE